MKKSSWLSLKSCDGASKAEPDEMIVLDANILIRTARGAVIKIKGIQNPNSSKNRKDRPPVKAKSFTQI